MTGGCGKSAGTGWIAAALWAVLCAAGSGCTSQIDFERPVVGGEPFADAFDSGKPYVPQGKSPDEIREERLAQALAAWKARPKREEAEHRVSPGDLLEISIFPLEDVEKSTAFKRTVSGDGTVTLPWTGTIQVKGMLPREVEGHIRDVAKRYIKNPECTVTVTGGAMSSVLITGAVNKAGAYPLKDCATVLHLLSQCGGLLSNAGDDLIITRGGQTMNPAESAGIRSAEPAVAQLEEELRGEEELAARAKPSPVGKGKGQPERIVVDLKQLLEDGNLLFNMELASGDLVSVPARVKKFVHIMGFVRNPGSYEITDYGRVDAVQAVALSGGLDTKGRAENAYLVRQTANGRQRIPVDLIKLYKGVRPPLYMEDGDVLVVGTHWLVRLADSLRPSLDSSGPPFKVFSTGVGAIR